MLRTVRMLCTIIFLSASFSAAGAAEDAGSSAGEMEALRIIAATPDARLADLCAIILIQRGEFDAYPDSDARCKAVADLQIYQAGADELPVLTRVTAGAASKAAIRAHKLEKSILFAITGAEWYAVQNAEALGLLEPRTHYKRALSGAELLAIMENALLRAQEKEHWLEPVNPYAPFGVNSYDELNKAYDKAADSDKSKK